MHRTFKRLVGFVFALCWASNLAYAADPACEHFKTKAPILDVLKDPRKVGDYVGELQRGDVVCIKQKRKIGRRTWGLVDHMVLEDGKIDKLNGWVGLRFMTPHKLTTAGTLPKTKGVPKTAAPSPYTPAKKGKSKAEIDREAEIAYWNTVRDSEDPELIASYLTQYPNGTFAKLARLMLDKIDQREDQADVRRKDDAPPLAKPQRSERKPKVQQRERRERAVSRPSRDDRRSIEQRRREQRDRAERRRSQRERAERRRRDRARRAERRRAQEARNRRRADRERPRRKRRPRCRMETRFECIKRGGTINSSGDCNVDRICE